MIVTRTPNRVSLVGGGTDLPDWCSRHEGVVVGGAVTCYSYVHLRRLPPFHEYRSRFVYSDVERVARNGDVSHRAIRACLEAAGMMDEPVEMFHAADLPGRSGTGSSSSFCVGMLNALYGLRGRLLSPAELAEAAIDVERNLLGETVGAQDQYLAAHGGLNVMRFRPQGVSVLPLAVDRSVVADLERHLALFYSGEQRTSSAVSATYAGSLAGRREMWEMVRLAEAAAAAVAAARWRELADLVDRGWKLKAGLSPAVSTERLAALYNAGRVHGAWGGKVTGAGGGGSLLFVVPPERHASVRAALEGMGAVYVPFRFDFDGSRAIFLRGDAE